MASESVTINSTAPELRMVRRLVPASMSGDSVPGSGIPGRIYNFTTPSFMDMDEGVGKDATDPESRRIGSSDSDAPQPPSSSGALFTSIQLPHPWSSQFHWIEVRRAALHHRATLLFSLKNDPRFLSFLPMVFPIPPSPRRALQPKDSAVALVFCTRRLATLYPGYPERIIQGHVLLDLEGILPFIPYITEHDYDPCDLSRRLSPDIPSNDIRCGNTHAQFLDEDLFRGHEPGGVGQFEEMVNDTSSSSTEVDDSSTEDGGSPSPLLSRMYQRSSRFKEYSKAWQTYYIKFQSGDGMYQIELIFSKVIISSLCLAFLLGALSFLILYALGISPLLSLFLSAPFSAALLFVSPV